jgi:hypothetical protein
MVATLNPRSSKSIDLGANRSHGQRRGCRAGSGIGEPTNPYDPQGAQEISALDKIGSCFLCGRADYPKSDHLRHSQFPRQLTRSCGNGLAKGLYASVDFDPSLTSLPSDCCCAKTRADLFRLVRFRDLVIETHFVVAKRALKWSE